MYSCVISSFAVVKSENCKQHVQCVTTRHLSQQGTFHPTLKEACSSAAVDLGRTGTRIHLLPQYGTPHTYGHQHTLSAHPLTDLCEVSTAETLGHLGNVWKINVRGNGGFTEVCLENGEAGLQGRQRKREGGRGRERERERERERGREGGREGDRASQLIL